MEYNTTRNDLAIREYGRHVQKLIEYAVEIEDKEERQKFAESVINLMGQLNPHLRNVADFKHKLWDHLFIISDFKLDVDSPYDVPERETFEAKPAPLPYPQTKIRYKHYGKNVQTMVNKAVEMEDDTQREGFTEVIANFMKMAYQTWSGEEVSDALIKADMVSISGGKLKISEEMNIEAFSSSTKHRKKKDYSRNNKRNNSKKRYRK